MPQLVAFHRQARQPGSLRLGLPAARHAAVIIECRSHGTPDLDFIAFRPSAKPVNVASIFWPNLLFLFGTVTASLGPQTSHLSSLPGSSRNSGTRLPQSLQTLNGQPQAAHAKSWPWSGAPPRRRHVHSDELLAISGIGEIVHCGPQRVGAGTCAGQDGPRSGGPPPLPQGSTDPSIVATSLASPSLGGIRPGDLRRVAGGPETTRTLLGPEEPSGQPPGRVSRSTERGRLDMLNQPC